MKKFNCVITCENGAQELQLFEAKNKKVLKKKLKEEGLRVRSIREEFSIKGSLTLFVVLTFFIALPAAGFDAAYMSTLVLILIGICWVLSLLTRNPRKAVFPAMITLAMVFWTMAISANLSRGMKKMIPEGDAIVVALEHYHTEYGHYPNELGQLVPRFMPMIPDEPFHYYYYPRTDDSYGLVTTVVPFDVVYHQDLKRWVVHYPT